MASNETTRSDIQQSVDGREHLLDEQFGLALRKLRETRGWSLSYLGEVCGTSGANISKIERGGSKVYSLALLARLSAAYGMKLYELFAFVESVDVTTTRADSREGVLLEAYRSMPEMQRDALVSVALTLRPPSDDLRVAGSGVGA